MDTLRNMRMFVRVVESGSFSKAASREAITPAQVSRAIMDLEARLRAHLINRTTRRMSLTHAGERYLLRCRQILSDVERAEAEAADACANPVGKLKIHCATGLGQRYLVPLIANYRKQLPEVSIELSVAQQLPNVLDEGFDVSIAVAAELEDSALISRRLGRISMVLCASPGYLAEHGAPSSFDELGNHACLHLGGSGHWTAEGDGGETVQHAIVGPFQVDNDESLALALRAGMGIGQLPLPVALPALTDGSLVLVLPEFRLTRLNVYVLYASRRYLDAKIRTFVEFLREQVPLILAGQETALRTHSLGLPRDAAADKSHQKGLGLAERLRLVN